MKVQYNGFRGGIYLCHQNQHDNYLKFIIWCVYICQRLRNSVTILLTYVIKEIVGSDIYDPEKQEQNI